MFADPQTVTVATVAQSLAGTERGPNESVYQKNDGSYTLRVGHIYRPSRKRFTARIDHNKLVADPFVAANNIRVSASVYLVMDVPVLGYTNVEVRDYMLGLSTWADQSKLDRILGGET